MRLPATSPPKLSPKGGRAVAPVPAVERMRRLVMGRPAQPAPAQPLAIDDLPGALDERVRLIGEW